MEDRSRSEGGSPGHISPSSQTGSRSRSSSPPPRSARRMRTVSAPPDEMRIQVHDDGLVEFSVKLDADLDAEQLATLVAAVRSSARPRVKRSNYASRRNGAVSSDGPVSSPDAFGAAQQQLYQLDQSGRRIPPSSAPRLPDRIPTARSGPTQQHLPSPGTALTATDDAEMSTWLGAPKRSVSTPDLRADIARLTAMRSGHDSTAALTKKLSYNGGSSKYKFVDEAEDPVKSSRPFPQFQLEQPTTDDLNKNWRDVEYELTEKYRTSDDIRGSATGSSGPNVAAHRTFHVPPSPSPGNSGPRRPWRIFSQIGARLRRRRQSNAYDPAQEAIGKGGSDNPLHGGRSSSTGMKMKSTAGGAGPYLEFATLLTPEQALAELARFAKLRGFQVWRRPGEHKLRCIRKLSSSQEMHLVILVESQIHAPTTLVRIRRARGDRGKTEWWRFSHFHRDVIARFTATGLSVVPTEPPVVQQVGLSFHKSG